ncbi:hypothetical protein GKE82_05515 [Conexibacter sp. W3-3-2]|uniref:hypothetical protein n=1 Tax=Conexibacter sp. W3-3-2 TaxID=2675227 RepID=UPI0012B91D33|nr:hypothetical protein [Conexibacter sp. W3-3-2]MTD43777.1 hypothetical protein [Conexibacter sp. W3-3-2]
MSPLDVVQVATYTTDAGEHRVLEASRTHRGYRLNDLPATPGEGDSYLVEADLLDVEELRGVVMDYLAQTELSGLIPMDTRRVYPDTPLDDDEQVAA